MKYHTPSIEEINKARRLYEANEPRDLFYRAATELVDLAMRGATSLTVAEALGVLLQTWNVNFYRFHATFDHQHLLDIECLLASHHSALTQFRQRSIDSFCREHEPTVKSIFEAFEKVLGTVGASKALHLLAPRFFPLWDRDIANSGYHLNLQKRGTNGDRYCRFIEITRQQCAALGGQDAIGRNPLKAIDEYNYCRYTNPWIWNINTEKGGAAEAEAG